MSWLRGLRYARRYRNWREIARARDRREKPGRAVLRDGTAFEAPPGTNAVRVVTPVFHKHVYTPPGLELRPDDAVVDVGANIGAFAVYAGQRSRGRLLAIEPHPDNAEFLRRNLRANGIDRAEVAQCAVADEPGTLPLFLGRSGTTHRIVGGPREGEGEASIDVPVVPLPQLLAEHGFEKVDFLKLDCEGAEGLILPNLPDALFRGIRAIALEFHDSMSPVGHEDLAKLLSDRGFTVSQVWVPGSHNGMLFAHR